MDTTLFEGLRVVEIASGMAGPMAGMLLADHGADVVKIEPPRGDWARELPGFLMWNRGKRSLVLDLREDDARTELDALTGNADVLLLSGGPDIAEHLGIDVRGVRAQNPGLVACEITGFGPLARDVGAVAYEGVVAAELGRMLGLDRLSGAQPDHPADRPAYTAAPVMSYGAANLAVQGIVGALIARLTTGRGDVVRISLAEAASVGSMRHSFAAVDRTPERDESHALVRAGIALTFMVAQCRDDKWIQMCARQDAHFRNWLRALELDDVLDDPRFARAPLGFQSSADIDELDARIRARMRTRTQSEWIDVFTERFDVGADPFLVPDEFLAHPQMTINGRIVVIEDPVVGPVTQIGPLVLMSETPAEITRAAPGLGADSGSVVWTPRVAPSVRASAEPRGPLAGVTIVELATFLAGPLGATLAAELGARVIKVEPPEGDSFRRVGLEAVHLMSGKESVVLDLKSESGRAVLDRLLTRADVLLQNFRPGVADRLGFGYERVRELNPSLVYVTAGSYGPKGPQAHRAAFHSTPNALSGGGILQAGADNPPVDDSYPDPCAGTAVATAIVLGLYHRARTGRGQHVETSMLASAGYVHSNHLVRYDGAPDWELPDHGQHGPNAGYRLYECASGWLFLAAVTDRDWRRLAVAVSRPEWIESARITDASTRRAHDTELVAGLTTIFATKSADAWRDVLVEHGVAAAVADGNRYEATLIDAGMMDPSRHDEFGAYWKFRPRITFDELLTSVGPPCHLGEHTDAVLAELGCTDLLATGGGSR